jgi:hypothetical protein
MRLPILLLAAPLLVLPSCYQFEVTAQAAYAQLTLDGDLGYQNGATTASVQQDIQSAFGLGEAQGVPYGRVMLDVGVPVLAVSGFQFEESGSGVLQANFGDVPAGIGVNSDFEMTNGKASLAFQIDLGPVAVSPGLAVDYFDLKVDVQDVFGAFQESVELAGPVPMLFLRAEADLGIVAAVAEGGYMRIDLDEVTASLLDLEALVEVRPTSLIHLFVGYRLLNLAADGTIDGDTFDTDITLSGFFVGGGVRF